MARPLPHRETLMKAVEDGLKPGALTMAEVINLQPRDQWQFSCDVVKKPDGKLVAVLTDARASIWDPEITPADRLNMMAKMLEQSAEGLRATAQAVKS